MNLAFIDIETTGLDQSAGHRIIEVAIKEFTHNGDLVKTLVERINPERPIDAESERVHGILIKDLEKCLTWDSVGIEVAKFLESADVLIAHNLDFDKPFLDAELARIGLTAVPMQSYCTMKNGRWACFDGKLPKLQELCFALGVEYDPAQAHSAEYDLNVLAVCYFAGASRGFFEFPVAT
jgi:DNA polymerase-3 subunit epsilon